MSHAAAQHHDIAGDWTIDPDHSRFGFSARHAMVTTVRGAFNQVQGRFSVGATPTDTSVRITLATAAVDTRNAQRDEHLRSADFFDVERWPEIVFVGTSVEEVEQNAYLVTGRLTIRDVTREVTMPIELIGVQRDAYGNLRAGFEGSRRLNRRDFGLEWNVALDAGGVLVSERINVEYELSAIKSDTAS
ncbi:YceI family protein [Ornithinicoccus hortensis]|uniref:Polyisoprenoid-binding protein YceI n=1 Tax=Ornithinicoccus hortensis TaxID=82346 RepID=A0A542YTM4_9MICO|nr:YceI family protein [Ornithinicoccus hortensis]TQL51401.1 polyisoprenoid-binding protein YceI [Ornithinicoccus hortensis]